MSDTPWTPGPWLFTAFDAEILGGDGTHVAHVRLGVDAPARHAANARLIAAAPEMEELLSEFIAGYKHDLDHGVIRGTTFAHRVNDLLSRIRGEA
jgi:hypothetical protein